MADSADTKRPDPLEPALEPLQLPAPATDDAAVLRSGYFSPTYLIALGRVIELSASAEALLRQTLGAAMGISGAGADALFLGDRYGVLHARLEALTRMQGLPEWLPEAVQWSKTMDRLIERRNKVAHRAPIILTNPDDEDDRRVGLQPSRRTQQYEPIERGDLMQLLRDLDAAYEWGMHAAVWRWTSED